jgi:hypothetical protein
VEIFDESLVLLAWMFAVTITKISGVGGFFNLVQSKVLSSP